MSSPELGIAYDEGAWHAVVTGASVALLAPEVPIDALRDMWRAMRDADGLAVVLETLVGAFGASMSSLPGFAVATFDESGDRVRVVARGAVQVHVRTHDERAEQVSGLGVTTWTERTFDAPSVLLLSTTGVGDAPLPLRDGVVAAGRVEWVFRADAEIAGAEVAAGGSAAAGDVAGEDATGRDTATPARADRSRRAPRSEPEPAPAPGVAPPPVPDGAAVAAVAPEPQSVPEPPSSPSSVPEPPAAAESLDADAGLTLSTASIGQTALPVPDLTYGGAAGEISDETTGYDDLIFGETRMSTVEDAAVRAEAADAPHAAGPTASVPVPLPPPPAPLSTAVSAAPAIPPPPRPGGMIDSVPLAPAPVPAPASAPQLGDHDGETISADQLALLQAQLAQQAPAAVAPLLAAGGEPKLVLSTGEVFVLDRGAVIGRRPRAVRATGVVPHLVTVTSPDISRNHVELRVDGANVVAVDLDTMNGTRLLRVGAEPVRMHPGETTLLVAGDRLDLGDGIVLSFEGL